MDTKSKRSNPLGAWLAFFIGIHLMLASVAGGVYLASRARDVLAKDYRDTTKYKSNIESNFYLIIKSIETDKKFGWDYSNILYFGSLENNQNNDIKNIQTNSELKSFSDARNFVKDKTDEYDYLFMWDGSNFSIIKDNTPINVSDDEYYSNMQTSHKNEFQNIRVLIAVKKALPFKSGGIYNSFVEWRILRAAFPTAAVFFITGIVLLIISSIKRSSRKEFTARLGKLSGYLWIEFKILATLFILMVISVNDVFANFLGLYTLFWWSYLMFLDLSVNKFRFFTNNSITWLMKIYHSYENKKHFQKAMLHRFLGLIGIELFLMFIVFVLLTGNGGDAVPFAFVITCIGIYLLYLYFKYYTKFINDIGKIVDQTELVRNGDLNTKLSLPENSIMYKTAENLNHIQEGVSTASQEQLKSERMKIELITNVSHDLKTPLTSIVNYIDLLSREELLPEHANDYVKVLSKKAARLTALTQDLFDISKAQSGNLELNIEKIDIVELVKQSIAELEERIAESSLNFRINLPQDKVHINADGRKLFRVFDNLISNILKYSHANTRVYIDLMEDNETVTLSFKNIASYEMNLNPQELMERFVRGDEARSTDGSGLGLAIVQSFVALSGGEFNIEIDGDLFKAIVKFKKA